MILLRFWRYINHLLTCYIKITKSEHNVVLKDDRNNVIILCFYCTEGAKYNILL